MKQLKIAIFLALLIPVLIVLNVNASRKVEESFKKAEFQLEDAAVDAMITVKAKALFIQEPTLSARDIHVNTQEQIVVLTGEVDTQFEENVALNLVESIKEVRAVRSELKVWLA